jgi:predicted nucleic acid-binding protein
VILVDTNVFMYAAGRPHPHRKASTALLEAIARGSIEAAVDAEVLQEILHRYRAIGRWNDGRRVYDLVRPIVPDVVDIGASTVDAARALMDRHPGLLARDAVHAAATQELAADALCSWDTDFDAIPEIRRLTPAQVLTAG